MSGVAAGYLQQSDLENALNVATVLALYDDGTGQLNTTALAATFTRASTWVDSYLARSYRGPFPIVQQPVAAMILNAALEFAVCFSFERHPEYVKSIGEDPRAEKRYARANALMERIADALQEIPDLQAQPKQGNIGGVIYSAGPRMIIDSLDGTYNGGDF